MYRSVYLSISVCLYLYGCSYVCLLQQCPAEDVLLWTSTYGRPARTSIQQLCEDTGCSPEDLPNIHVVQDDQHEHPFSNYVRIRDVVQKTCRRRWTIGKSGERGSGISVLPARHDDDDTCVCMHVWLCLDWFAYQSIFIWTVLFFKILFSFSLNFKTVPL